jgi:hypothetical protein
MREVRQGFNFDAPAQEKVASDDAPSKAPPRHLAKYALENLRDEFKIERMVEENAWEAKIAELSKRFRLAEGYGPSFAEFEKDAYAAFGSDAVPEMAGLCAELRRDFVLPTQEKVAALTARRVVDTSALELRLLKEAGEARAAFEKYEAGLKWIAAHLQ